MPYDIGKAFARIEKELMTSMIHNMEHHKAEEIKEGYQWSQWQVEQLRALEEYRKRNRKKFPKKFREINGMIPAMIEEARADGQMNQEADILEAISKGFKAKKSSGDITGAFFEVNDRKLNALIEATTNDFERAEVAILRRAEDQYRQVIFDAQVYANAGGTTYEKAVDMATKDLISKGIDCVEYANGARHTLSDYADMAIRTAVKRAYLTGEGEKRKEWGIATVIVNKRGNPCPKCAPFCGKVLIDDVWSGGEAWINGADRQHSKGAKAEPMGTSPDTNRQYPLMSTAIKHGLYHPRCRDSHTTYFPGISTADDKWSKEELEEIGANYEADQMQKYAERQAEKYERLAETRLDSDNKRQCEARSEGWRSKSDELTERRKRRLAERKKASEPKTSGIQFDDHVSEQQRQLLENLSSQYNTRLQHVEIGAEKAAGDVDVSGSRMRLSDKHENTAIHEFAHTLAHTNADKFGLTQDQDFWKEIRKIRREYMKDVEGDPSRWISTYEHSSRSLDEFMAEAFTHAKMRELGLPIPDKYGKDFTYSQRVLDTVDKYFGKSDEGVLHKAVLGRAKIIKTEVDLRKVSNSAIIKMNSMSEIIEYFSNTHGITVSGFDNKALFDIKAVLSGYDDMLLEFPEAQGFIKSISYNSHIRDNGNINLDTGLSEIGPSGLKDYGAGIHEVAHIVDHLRSVGKKTTYAEQVLKAARKNLKLRINSTKYRNMVVKMVGMVKDQSIYDDPIEIFAYAFETSKGGIQNEFADEVYRIVKGGEL